MLLFSACRKEEIITTDSSAKLQFSADTILFDTVFTSKGSTSRRLKVYNRNKNAIRISKIAVAGADRSSYQININGQPVSSATNLEISGRDSLNIFIRVLINPGTAALPFIVSDSLTFQTNGNRQIVQLRAYGQNAHFLNEELINGNVTWDNKLPYVIYNSALVTAGSRLTIEKGSRIYFHKDSKLFVAGSLQALGEPLDTICFGGDRREQVYSDEPGQWGGIHFLSSSRDNVLGYARIRNAVAGVRVDSLSNNADPKLIIHNSVIKNMQVAGLLMYNADVSGFNNLVYNCGQFLLYSALGGRYDFKQNTFAALNFILARQTPAVYFADFYQADKVLQTAALDTRLVNNIIWGSNVNELLVERKGNSTFTVSIQSNLMKINTGDFGSTNLLNQDPLFADARKENYRLMVASPALKKGAELGADKYYGRYLQFDLLKNTRIFPSALGCYEFK
jgi:hypothetical protein